MASVNGGKWKRKEAMAVTAVDIDSDIEVMVAWSQSRICNEHGPVSVNAAQWTACFPPARQPCPCSPMVKPLGRHVQ